MITTKIKKLRPIKDHVVVRDMSFSHRVLNSGLFIPSDDKKSEGIRPRWAKIFAVGPEQKDVLPGQWICISHGRWTRGLSVEVNGEVFTIRRVDNNDILLVSDEEPEDETLGSLGL